VGTRTGEVTGKVTGKGNLGELEMIRKMGVAFER
jgi:hypothetical protein